MTAIQALLVGALGMGCLAIGVIFLRLWRDSGDRFFLFFALSFLIQALNRAALAFALSPKEGSPWHYGIRLIAYLLIIWAIIEKNRPAAVVPRER